MLLAVLASSGQSVIPMLGRTASVKAPICSAGETASSSLTAR